MTPIFKKKLKMNTIYHHTATDNKGNNIPLSDYKNKIILIVNTATRCGFTPQYQELEQLYQQYKQFGFEILDFPCNQFGKQAPENDQQIAQICQLKYKTTFKTFAKINVNGKNAHPLYKHLKKESKGFITNAIKWNFTKFLVDRQRKVQHRFSPLTKPNTIAKYINELI